MKEFKYCHEEITEGVEIPVTVCETQKEMVDIIVNNYRDSFKFAMERLDEVMKSYENGGFDYEDVFGRMKRNERAYHRAIDTALGGTDEETVYIIYKDGSTYFQNGGMGCEGKFKRTGIARAMISTAYEAVVFGDFAINDMGDVTIEEREIEEYGIYAGQYDVKEQEVQETVEQTTEVEETAENAMESAEVKTNSELHLDEEIVKAFEKQKSSFKFYGVDMAYQVERYVNCGSLKYVQLGTYSDYSKAVQAAYEAIKEWGEENIYFHTVEIAKRNSKTAKDKYDREILKSEKKEIGYYWYASRLTNSKECVHISIDSPIKIPIETTQKSEIKEVKETVETETAETAEQETTETVEGVSKMETPTETDDSGFEYTTSQAQEIIMAGTSIAREKYREKHGIHSPMDLKKFSRKQLDDYLSKELDYINKFLNDTLPKEVFNAMKGEIMYA